MSFNQIVNKLLTNAKEELKDEENLKIFKDDILQPIVEQIFYVMYPYFIGVSLVVIFIIMLIFIILFLNIKICYSGNMI
jgi:hypothetical protein